MSQYFRTSPGNFSHFPPVVKNLLIINGLCFLANIVLGSRGLYDMNEHFGLYYPESSLFRPFQFITHVFMHGSWTHLLFNMFSLWMFGKTLENYWGPQRFFIYYFVTAFGAAALYLGVNAFELHRLKEVLGSFTSNPGFNSFYEMIQKEPSLENYLNLDFLTEWKKNPDNPFYLNEAKSFADKILEAKLNNPVVGASGAVFGLLLGFGMLFPNTELIMLFFPFPIKAKYFVMLYGALELYQGIDNNPGDNVAHFAHLGGMLFGFILIKIWNKNNRSTFY